MLKNNYHAIVVDAHSHRRFTFSLFNHLTTHLQWRRSWWAHFLNRNNEIFVTYGHESCIIVPRTGVWIDQLNFGQIDRVIIGFQNFILVLNKLKNLFFEYLLLLQNLMDVHYNNQRSVIRVKQNKSVVVDDKRVAVDTKLKLKLQFEFLIHTNLHIFFISFYLVGWSSFFNFGNWYVGSRDSQQVGRPYLIARVRVLITSCKGIRIRNLYYSGSFSLC